MKGCTQKHCKCSQSVHASKLQHVSNGGISQSRKTLRCVKVPEQARKVTHPSGRAGGSSVSSCAWQGQISDTRRGRRGRGRTASPSWTGPGAWDFPAQCSNDGSPACRERSRTPLPVCMSPDFHQVIAIVKEGSIYCCTQDYPVPRYTRRKALRKKAIRKLEVGFFFKCFCFAHCLSVSRFGFRGMAEQLRTMIQL